MIAIAMKSVVRPRKNWYHDPRDAAGGVSAEGTIRSPDSNVGHAQRLRTAVKIVAFDAKVGWAVPTESASNTPSSPARRTKQRENRICIDEMITARQVRRSAGSACLTCLAQMDDESVLRNTSNDDHWPRKHRTQTCKPT